MALPSIMIALAENQRFISEELCRANLGLNLGYLDGVAERHIAEALSSLLVDRNQREGMSRNGRRLVDGMGAGWVVSSLHLPEQSDLPVFGR